MILLSVRQFNSERAAGPSVREEYVRFRRKIASSSELIWTSKIVSFTQLQKYNKLCTILLGFTSLICCKILPNRLFEVVLDLPEEATVLPDNVVKRVVLIKTLAKSRLVSDAAQPVIGVSKELAFNMFGSSLVQNVRIKALKEVSKEVLPVAKEIRVSLIRRPENQSDHNGIKRSLFAYFSVQRVIYSGDVIALRRHGKTRLFFKVLIIQPNTSSTAYLVSNKTTKCVQFSDVACFYPSSRIDLQTEFIPHSLHQLALRIGIILRPCLLPQSQSTESNAKSVVVLIAGSDDGGHLLLHYLSDLLCLNILEIDCFDFWQSKGSTEKRDTQINAAFEQALNLLFLMQPQLTQCCWKQLKKMSLAICILDCLAKAIAVLPSSVVLVLTCKIEELDKLPKKVAKIIHFEFMVDSLKEEERKAFFEFHSNYLKKLEKGWLLSTSRGLSLPELNQMLEEARLEAIQNDRVDEVWQEDIKSALRRRKKAIGDVVGVPKVPKVTWNDVGGLEEVKQLISESLQMNLSTMSGSKSLRRSGIILYGPPGCGKTLVAKAVANQFQMAFLSVKGPELLNQYVGQSEKNLRNVFEKARAVSPSILFFDELDSLAPNRGVAGDSGGVMDRMVSQLLSEMDSIQWKTDSIVFVMAATNRPDLIDPCLLTPGRFDKAVLVKPADDIESKKRILRTICKTLCLEPGLTVHKIACQCPPSMSGAELTSLMSKATMHSMREVIQRMEKCPNEIREEVFVCEKHVEMALQEFISTMTPTVHQHYSSIQKHL